MVKRQKKRRALRTAKPESSKFIIYLLLSVLSATTASLIFLATIKPFENSLPLLAIYGIILWSVSNAFFVATLRNGEPALAYTLFGIGTFIADGVAGIVIQGNIPTRPIFMILGTGIGVTTILLNSKSKTTQLVLKEGLEILLYALAAVLIYLGIKTALWEVQVLAFAIADFAGMPLSFRVLKALVKNNQPTFKDDLIAGIIAFSPVVFSLVILLKAISNLAFIGPVAGIASTAIAVSGSLAFEGKTINAKKLKKVLVWLVAAISSIAFIHLGFS